MRFSIDEQLNTTIKMQVTVEPCIYTFLGIDENYINLQEMQKS
jgi:hypothetical protein